MTDEPNLENSKAQMRKGTLEFCIMLIISRGEVYASDILQQLKAADLLVVEGTLYPLLSRLKTQGFLLYSWKESNAGPPRKYYSLTDKGKTSVKMLTDNWLTLADSINQLIKQHHAL